jgi:ribosomal protein L18
MEAETATASRRPTCTKANIDSPSTSNCRDVSILKELSPIPDASSRRRTDRKRKSQRSKILTSSPYKAAVAERAQRKVIAGTIGRKCKRTLSMVQSTSKQREENHIRGEPAAQVEKTISIICAETFDENWIQCCTCKGWAHEGCSGVEPHHIFYNCDICIGKGK